MLTFANPVETAGGATLYRDDYAPKRFYSLPSRLSLARSESGEGRFTLLFYQEDAPERGARMVAAFTPLFPKLDAATLPAGLGPDCRVESVGFTGGDIRFRWLGLEGDPVIVNNSSGDCFWSDLSLSQYQAQLLRQTLKLGAETVLVLARLSYSVAIQPQPARVRIRLRQAAQQLRSRVGQDELTGETLCQWLPHLPSDAVKCESVGGEGGSLTLTADSVQVIAPLLAAQIADPQDKALVFSLQSFKLRPLELTETAELMFDLSRPRTRQCLWEGEWSLSGFYAEVMQDGSVARYFPEILSLPPVGMVDLLIENLLPMDAQCIEEVGVKVRYRRLGSLEEAVFRATFGAFSSAVVCCSVPKIALTDFSYWYQAQVLLAQEESSHPGVRLFPEHLEWTAGREPFIRIGAELLPFTLAYVAIRPEVFAHAPRVDVEIAAADSSEPQAVRAVTLLPSAPHRWITLDSARFGNRTMRWRPVMHADPSGNGQVISGWWQTEGSLNAVVTLAHVYPRTPMRIQATALFLSVAEVRGVICEITMRSVAPDAPSGVADLRHTFITEEVHDFVLWPESIFDTGFSYRYGIDVGGTQPIWAVWRQPTEPRILMNVLEEFYATRTICVGLRGPWSELAGPNPAKLAGEILFAEVNLNSPLGGQSQSKCCTFDKSNIGTEFSWKARMHKGEKRISYEVNVLTVDGRSLSFGPFETDQERLSMEVCAVQVSDGLPAEFSFRSLP
jgi:hypothetical protein